MRGEIAKLCPNVIACDKREAFAQGSDSDDRVRRSSTSEGGSNPFFLAQRHGCPAFAGHDDCGRKRL